MAAAWPAREGTRNENWAQFPDLMSDGDGQEHEWGFDDLEDEYRYTDLIAHGPTIDPDYLANDLDWDTDRDLGDHDIDLASSEIVIADGRNHQQEEDEDTFVQSHSHAGRTSSSRMGNEQSSINSARPASRGMNYLPPASLFTTSSPRLQQTPPTEGNRHEDWLDRPTRSTSTAGFAQDDFFDAVSDRTLRSPVHDPEDLDSDAFEVMPTFTRHRRESIVDLTADPSSPQQAVPPRPTKRSAENQAPAAASSSNSHRAKRQRPSTTTTSASAAASRSQAQDEPIEELDLTQSPISAMRAAEQARAIAAQQASEPSGPLRIGQRQCIICMEAYTNATVTPCGHIYCHECLDQALKQGEKNSDRHVGTCPVCRQEIHRDDKKKRKGGKPVAIAFMKKSAFRSKGRPALEAASG
ncbi:hypothetical protein LTR86_008577 [Recurvomyces mirabilis]|nr:hypothetical protein LTR86_008577 [Recurvomyces mirabilis]